MRKGGIAESADLSAYLQGMYRCEWEAEVGYFLWDTQNRLFRVKGMVEEQAKNTVKNMRRETIQVK